MHFLGHAVDGTVPEVEVLVALVQALHQPLLFARHLKAEVMQVGVIVVAIHLGADVHARNFDHLRRGIFELRALEHGLAFGERLFDLLGRRSGSAVTGRLHVSDHVGGDDRHDGELQVTAGAHKFTSHGRDGGK